MLPPPGAPRDDIKRKFSFHLNPLPLASTLIGATWSSFFGYKNSRLERLIKREYLDEGWEGRYINNLKTVHNLKKMHCGRNGLLLLAKNALLEKGPKKSGMGRPPTTPPHSGTARKKTFFSIDVFPKLPLFVVIVFVFGAMDCFPIWLAPFIWLVGRG